MIDLNFLPERYRRRGPTLRSLRPAMFLLGFALLLIPLSKSWSVARGRLLMMEAALAQVQTELEEYQPLAEERSQLEARIEAASIAAGEIQAAYDTVNIQNMMWNRLVARSLGTVPNGATVTQILQAGEEIVFEGTASTYLLPSRFADELRDLGDYATVTIQSVSRLERAEAEATAPPEEELAGEESAEEDTPEVPQYQFEISAKLPLPPEPDSPPGSEGGEES